MGLTTCPSTGKVTGLRVCSHCEQAGNQGAFVRSYAKKVMKVEDISHGICVPHYQAQMASLLGERESAA